MDLVAGRVCDPRGVNFIQRRSRRIAAQPLQRGIGRVPPAGAQFRNVRFSQTVDLARRLAGTGVEVEEMVIPDDTHHMMKHTNWVRVDSATAAYFRKKLMGPAAAVGGSKSP